MNPADQASTAVRSTRETTSAGRAAAGSDGGRVMPGRARRGSPDWARRHERTLLLVLAAVAAVDRALLAWRSPTPYGYVFDFYHEAIQKTYALGRLAIASDCWQCYHPPLLPLLGLPLYAVGKALVGGPGGLGDPALRFVAPLSLACAAVAAFYAYRTLRLFRFAGTDLTIGSAIVLAFPCLFFSSYG